MSMVKITSVLDQVSKVEVMQDDLLKDHWAEILKERSKKLELIFFLGIFADSTKDTGRVSNPCKSLGSRETKVAVQGP